MDDKIIRASREAFGHEPDPIEARPFTVVTLVFCAIIGIAPVLILVGLLTWGLWR